MSIDSGRYKTVRVILPSGKLADYRVSQIEAKRLMDNSEADLVKFDRTIRSIRLVAEDELHRRRAGETFASLAFTGRTFQERLSDGHLCWSHAAAGSPRPFYQVVISIEVPVESIKGKVTKESNIKSLRQKS